MLAKLLKRDFASLSRILVPVHGAAVAVGVMAMACFFSVGPIEGFPAPSASSNPFAFLLMPLGTLCQVALGAAPVATLVVIVRRWYMSLFADEGHVTPTLPASANAHMASKTIAGFAWMMADLLIVLSLLIASTSVLSGSLIHPFGNPSTVYGSLLSAGSAVLSLSSGTAQALMILLVAYSAFALGATVATRHRVAAGVGLFVGSSCLIGVFLEFVVLAFSNAGYQGSYPPGLMQLASSATTLVLSLAAAAALYALCVYLLKRKANLP